MKKYIWQRDNWQDFVFDRDKIMNLLSKARFLQGELLGRISSLDINLRDETQSEILIEETIKTSKIEGLELNVDSVRSSVAQKLGFPQGVGIKNNRDTDVLVDILVDAVRNHETPLSLERLNGWHAGLFPLGYSGLHKITVGDIRKGEMKVVSGYLGKEKVHFEACDSLQAKKEIKIFLDWFNNSLNVEEGLLRAASAHLKFVTIHPYDDGNGRLARAVADMAMAQDEKSQMRYYSISSQIMKDRKDYYEILEAVQSLKIDLTDWYEWFIKMFINALKNSQELISAAFFKADFYNKIKDITLNERQRKAISKLLEAGVGNFKGGLSTRKYASINKVSPATAFREIEDMYEKGILKRHGKGRSIRYELLINTETNG